MHPSCSSEQRRPVGERVSHHDIAEAQSVLAGSHAAPGHGRFCRGPGARAGLRRPRQLHDGCPDRCPTGVPRHGSGRALLLWRQSSTGRPGEVRLHDRLLAPLRLFAPGAGHTPCSAANFSDEPGAGCGRPAAASRLAGSPGQRPLGPDPLLYRTSSHSLRSFCAFACPSCLLAWLESRREGSSVPPSCP
jgi:hypothetical protein